MALKTESVLRLGKPGLQIKTGTTAAAFNPSTYGTVVGWYDATQETGLADGTAVSPITDRSGSGHDLTAPQVAGKPLYKTAIQNGKPVYRFDGTNDFVKSAGFTLNQPTYWFLVAVDRNAFSIATDWTDGVGTAFSSLITRRSSTQMSLYAGSAVACNQTTTPQAWHVYTALFSGASSELRIDGGSAATGNPGAVNPGGIALGGDSNTANGSGYAALDVGELVVCTAVSNRAGMEAALKAKWGTP